MGQWDPECHYFRENLKCLCTGKSLRLSFNHVHFQKDHVNLVTQKSTGVTGKHIQITEDLSLSIHFISLLKK